MNDALPNATVTGYRTHLEAVALPDPDDRHVVAAAIAAGASVILTWNLRDFPTKELKKHGLVRQNPDAFLTALYDKAPDLTLASLGECTAQSQQDAHFGCRLHRYPKKSKAHSACDEDSQAYIRSLSGRGESRSSATNPTTSWIGTYRRARRGRPSPPDEPTAVSSDPFCGDTPQRPRRKGHG
jgi:hypothetical protein